MPKSTAFANDILKLILQAVEITGLAMNHTTSPLTAVTVALHTSDPGASGTQASNEIAYTGYVRPSVARSALGWSVTGNVAQPVAEHSFGPCSGGAGGMATHVSVGTGVSNKLLWRGTISPAIMVTVGVTPKIGPDTTITEVA